MRPIACPQHGKTPPCGGVLSRRMKFELAVLAALAALLVAAVRILLLLLAGLLAALLRITLLLLARLAVRIILMLRILVRIGHDYSLHCGAAHQTNARAATTFL